MRRVASHRGGQCLCSLSVAARHRSTRHPAQILASASYDDTIKLYIDDPQEDWFCFQTLSGHSSTVWSLAFSPDGRFLASASDDTTIRIWERVQEHKWEYVDVLEGHERSVYSISWGVGKPLESGDAGKLGWLASTGGDGISNVWELGVGGPVILLCDLANRTRRSDKATKTRAGRP